MFDALLDLIQMKTDSEELNCPYCGHKDEQWYYLLNDINEDNFTNRPHKCEACFNTYFVNYRTTIKFETFKHEQGH